MLNEAIELNFIPAIFLIGKYYFCNGEYHNSIKYLELGISKECKKCLEIMPTLFGDTTTFYIYLMQLSFTNNMIQQKMRELNSRVDLQKINNSRGKKLLLLFSNGDVIESGNPNIICNLNKT